jgi:DNA-binding CsgD family transcriptional regulator
LSDVTEGRKDGGISSTPESSQWFVGRHDELKVFADWAERARRGTSGIVWIEGDAGSGKSALVREALRSLPGDTQIMRASAHEYGATASLDLIHQLVPVEAATSFAEGLQLLELLSSTLSGELLVVVIEDLHWADADSSRALLSMTQRLDQEHLLLVVTSRPDLHNDEWQRVRFDPDRCGQITLGNFSVQEVADLAAHAGAVLAPRYLERLHQHTDGHPLYTRLLLSELTVAQLEQADDLPAPRSLASTTTAALAKLSEDARRLASALAVLNDAVPLSAAAQVAGIEAPAVVLEELLPSGLVVWYPRQTPATVQLAHPLFRAAIYDDLPPTMRRELHLGAAEVSDDATALVHRVAASETTDDELADELENRALDPELRLPAATRAQYLIWASSISSDRVERENRLIEAARMFLGNRLVSRALALRDQIERTSESPRRDLVLGMMDWTRGDFVDAEAHLLAASDAESTSSDPRTAAQALSRLASIRLTRMEAARGLDEATRARALRPDDDELRWETLPSLAIGRAILEGADRGLEELAAEFPASAAEAGFGDADLLVTRAMLSFYGGRASDGRRDLRRAIELARRGAPLAQHPRAHVHLCQLLFDSGDWDDAAVHAHLAVSLIHDDPHIWEATHVYAAAMLVPAARGQWDMADAFADQARAAGERSGTVEGATAWRVAVGWLARARSDWGTVVAALGPLDAAVEETGLAVLQRYWGCVVADTLVEAHLVLGHTEEAKRVLAHVEWLHEHGRMPPSAVLYRSRAAVAVAEGRSTDADEAFDAALACLDEWDGVLEQALLHRSIGRHRLAMRDRPGALRSLRRAVELLQPLGAAPYADLVEHDLAGLGGVEVGGDRTRTMLTLTEREQSVAALVASGLTNRQVASELYVSQKAVEYHLTNIYGKLGVRTRQELRNHPSLTLGPSGS